MPNQAGRCGLVIVPRLLPFAPVADLSPARRAAVWEPAISRPASWCASREEWWPCSLIPRNRGQAARCTSAHLAVLRPCGGDSLR